MRRASIHDEVRQHEEARQCNLDQGNQRFSGSDIVWLAPDVYAPRDIHWWNAISLLRPAFSRQVTFLWFALCCVGLSVRSDHLGVTSIVRALSLRGSYYDNLLDCCHSSAIKLPALTALWTQAAMPCLATESNALPDDPC